MDKNELPSSVPLANALLFRDDVPAVVLRTFARLYALAWKHHYDRTDRIVTAELLDLLGLSRRQMYDHIGKLHELGVLEWTSDGDYGYIFTFPKNSSVPYPDDTTGVAGAEVVDAWVTAPPPVGHGRPAGQTQQLELPAASGLRPEPMGAEIRTWESTPGAENRTPSAEIRTWESTPGAEDSTAVAAPDAENRSSGAEIRTWENMPAAENNSSTAENRTPGADFRTQPKPSAEIRSPSAENRTPGAEIRTSEAARRIADPSVGVVVNNIPDLDLEQQQQDPARASTAEIRTPSADFRTWPELEAALAQAGMWDDLAAGLAAGLDVDGALDALGWIAAVRADRRVHNHGAVLVKHLQAGRHAPADWRPPAVCATCGAVESRCTCGARERMVPAVYYTAAIEPVREWGRDRWGICHTCGRVDCDGHDPDFHEAKIGGEGVVEEEVAHPAASNGVSGQGNGLESRVRGAWPGVAQYIQARYGVEINLAEVGNYEVQVTFAGDDRRPILNLTRTMLGRELKDYVEVIDAGPG